MWWGVWDSQGSQETGRPPLSWGLSCRPCPQVSYQPAQLPFHPHPPKTKSSSKPPTSTITLSSTLSNPLPSQLYGPRVHIEILHVQKKKIILTLSGITTKDSTPWNGFKQAQRAFVGSSPPQEEDPPFMWQVQVLLLPDPRTICKVLGSI